MSEKAKSGKTAKTANVDVGTEQKVEVKNNFIDKTDQNWYNKKDTNSIVFCKSIDELIDGKSEKFEYTEKFVSEKLVMRNDKEVEKNHYVLFVMSDKTMIIVKKWNELK
jgi:hypothetical protein